MALLLVACFDDLKFSLLIKENTKSNY